MQAVQQRTQQHAGILVRVSSDKQAENYSPESQESECRAYAARLGMTVRAVHTEVFSGSVDLEERPVLRAVRSLIRNHTTDALIVYRLSRHTRAGGFETMTLAKECEAHGVELH